MEMPEIGDAAPAFEGEIQGGGRISLEDYRGKRLALYFYPRDNTPGCTKQACNLRDHFELLGKKGIHIVGVSDDPVEKHASFADKYNLPFPLLADPEKTVLQAYGVYGEKNMYGRTFLGTKRTTFLIDENGTVKHIIERPKVGKHAEEIVKAFEN